MGIPDSPNALLQLFLHPLQLHRIEAGSPAQAPQVAIRFTFIRSW
jgi:hypothetical protein